jgi:cytosine/adenosine deaminase-related metal-dependent hydrolase
MKTFILMQRAREGFDRRVNAQLALDMATRNGGLALDSSGKLGVISPGAYADLVLVDLALPSMLPSEKVLDNLVFSGGCRAVRHVIVNGELLVYDGRLRNEELYRRALEEFNEAAKRVSYR